VYNGNGYTSVSLYIVKIIKDTQSGEVVIYSSELSDNWYTELTEKEINIFKNNGWRYGVYVLTLSNFSLKHRRLCTTLELVNISKKNSKHSASYLENEIRSVEEKQNEIQIKLNKIK
jgi:archaellin